MCMYVYIHRCIYIYIYIYITHIYTYTHTCIHRCVCIYIYIYTHIRTVIVDCILLQTRHGNVFAGVALQPRPSRRPAVYVKRVTLLQDGVHTSTDHVHMRRNELICILLHKFSKTKQTHNTNTTNISHYFYKSSVFLRRWEAKRLGLLRIAFLTFIFTYSDRKSSANCGREELDNCGVARAYSRGAAQTRNDT